MPKTHRGQICTELTHKCDIREALVWVVKEEEVVRAMQSDSSRERAGQVGQRSMQRGARIQEQSR